MEDAVPYLRDWSIVQWALWVALLIGVVAVAFKLVDLVVGLADEFAPIVGVVAGAVLFLVCVALIPYAAWKVMRHLPEGWMALLLGLALIGAGAVRIIGGLLNRDPGPFASREQMLAWPRIVTGILIAAGTGVALIHDQMTRLAATVPMPVAGLYTLFMVAAGVGAARAVRR